MYPITEENVEIQFRIAVICSNTLESAVGFYLIDNAGLSYMQGAFVTAIIIGMVSAIYYLTHASEGGSVLDCLILRDPSVQPLGNS